MIISSAVSASQYNIPLSKCDRFLEAYILRIGPSEIRETCCHREADIPPMPRFYHISIDILSFLIALRPSIPLSIEAKPVHILSIIPIAQVVVLCRSIEYIDRETELMLTRSRRSTEGFATLSEIPHPLLVSSTPIGRDHREWDTEFFLEIDRHI